MLRVTDVEYLGNACCYARLQWRKKKVDLTPLLEYPAYKELKDESKFVQFGLDDTIFCQMVQTLLPNI